MPIIFVHVIMFILTALAVSFLAARARASIRQAEGKPVDRELLDPGFSIMSLLIFGVPALGCAYYLHSRGFDQTGLAVTTGAVFTGFIIGRKRAGILKTGNTAFEKMMNHEFNSDAEVFL